MPCHSVKTDKTDADKYISANRSCTVLDGEEVEQDVTASSKLSDDTSAFRFVLTWGDEASGADSDLDSHLYGPGINTDKKYSSTAYYDKTYYDESKVYEFLDLDDTSWSGPETTTVVNPVKGKYTFSVYNFSGDYDLSASNPKVDVYKGMIVGLSKKDELDINVCREKQLTNMRTHSSDGAIQLTPYTELSLEQCLDFLLDDELLEVTPQHLRLRKRELDPIKRKRAARRLA